MARAYKIHEFRALKAVSVSPRSPFCAETICLMKKKKKTFVKSNWPKPKEWIFTLILLSVLGSLDKEISSKHCCGIGPVSGQYEMDVEFDLRFAITPNNSK